MLLRIAKKSYNDTLLKDKELYMNPIELFRLLEDRGQGDSFENCAFADPYKLYIKKEEDNEYETLIDNSNEISPININNGIKVFCITYVDEKELLKSARNRQCEYILRWDTVSSFWKDREEMELLVFTDVASLVNLFDVSVKREGLRSCRGPVKYDQEVIVKDPQFFERVKENPFEYAFHKSKKYADQCEYRFALQIPQNDNKPYKLKLPRINDVQVSRFALSKGKDVIISFLVDNDEEEDKICCEVIV